MKLFYWTTVATLLAVSFASCSAWAQIGNPIGRPPGGANSPATAPATARSSMSPATPLSPAAPRSPASPLTPLSSGGFSARPGPGNIDASRNPRGFDSSSGRMYFGDGTSSGRTFGGNPGMFNRGPTTGITGTRTAADMLGRPNNRIGSAATLRQAERIRGGPNLVAPSFIAPGLGVFDGSFIGNNLPIVIDSTLIDRSGMINALPSDLSLNLSSDGVSPLVVPIIVPAIPDSPDTDTTDVEPRNTRDPRAPAESLDPLVDPGAQATATAIPARDPLSERTTRAPAQPRTVIRQGGADFVEVPTTSSRQSNTARSEATPRASQRATTLTQQYTIWQGYYWHHNPTSGWQYWDGGRWVNFN